MEGHKLDTLSELSWPASSSASDPMVSCKGDKKLAMIASQLADALKQSRLPAKLEPGSQNPPMVKGKEGEKNPTSTSSIKGEKIKEEKALPQHATGSGTYCSIYF